MAKQNAIVAAEQVYHAAQEIQEDQRGHTPWLNIGLDDIPDSAHCMDRNADTQTQFPSLKAAQEYRKILLDDNTKPDHTIPRTQAQLQAHALALFKAFKCIPEECQDRDDMKKWFVEERHNNQLVEVKCWEILHECINRSLTTTNLVEAHEPKKFKFKAGNMTFAERFDIIKETMALSKTICKHLFDVSFALKFVDDPAHNRARVESNRVLNTKKAEIMRRGKEQQAKEEKKAKRPRLMQSIADDPNTGEEMDDFEDTEVDETPVKMQTPRAIRATRPRTLDRARATSSHSTNPMGSMSAPQMRSKMYSPRHMGMQNSALQQDSSPLSNYSSSMGLGRMAIYGNNNDQFMATSNLSSMSPLGGMNYSPSQQYAQMLPSSPFSPSLNSGMNFAQPVNYPILRPESSMTQRTLYQPMQNAVEPWNPQTPSPRRTSLYHTSFNGNGSTHSGSSSSHKLAIDPVLVGTFGGEGWDTPNTPAAFGSSDHSPMGLSQFPRQFAPAPVRPGNFVLPRELVTTAGPMEGTTEEKRAHEDEAQEVGQRRQQSATAQEKATSISPQTTIDDPELEGPSFSLP